MRYYTLSTGAMHALEARSCIRHLQVYYIRFFSRPEEISMQGPGIQVHGAKVTRLPYRQSVRAGVRHTEAKRQT